MPASRRAAAAALVVTLLSLPACGDEVPPALRVGELAFGPELWTEVPAGGAQALADVAGLALAVRDGRLDSLVAPLAERAARQSRLRTLPYLLVARERGLGEDTLRAAYDAHPEWELDVRHVIRMAEAGAPPAERERALQEAEEVLRRARAGDDFAGLAAEFSEEPGAAGRGGLLEPGREGSWVQPFWEAAAALEPGQVSDVVETEYGFHVLRLDARRPVPFEEADRAALLRRVVPDSAALRAMAAWEAAWPGVPLDAAAAGRVAAGLRRGEVDDATLAEIAPTGGALTPRQLAAAWAALPADQQAALEDETTFLAWLEGEVREAGQIAEAERLGAPPRPGAGAEVRAATLGRALGWAHTFGFTAGAGDDALRPLVIRGATAAGQEFRIARRELEGIRPLLRLFYPLEDPSAASTSSRSSEMR